jgi:hypothetical protein
MASGLPAGNLDVMSVATPFLVKGALPSEAFPFLKATLPTGTAPEADVTVAVKVTGWPETDGFTLDATVTLVAAFTTVCVTVPSLPASVALPP